MNTLILEPDQFTGTNKAVLSERQLKHVLTVLKLKHGDTLCVGKLNGLLGHATFINKGERYGLDNILLQTRPPACLDFKVVLALPRPQMLKRILQTVAIFGVKELHLIQSNRVEKSFWQSPKMYDEAIRDQLILGLEQSKATQLPVVEKHHNFARFISSTEERADNTYTKLIAHPGNYPILPTNKKDEKMIIAIGPEGGFTQQEVAQFVSTGYSPVQLGPRILKVETAVTAFLGRLF